MSRKIKDIKDRHTGELVYPRTHVSAVVLSSDSTLEDLIEVKQDKIDDLDDIREGAAKGATALQSYTEQYTGTVTGVKMNGNTKNPSDGVVDLGTVITDASNIDFYDIKDNPIVNTGDGKLLFVDESGNIGLQLEQDNTLYVKDIVAGNHVLSNKIDINNIKTINGESIVGSGDITIEVGSAVTSININGQSKIPSSGVVDLGYVNKQLSTTTSSSMTLSPNIYYRNTSTSLSTLTITLGSVSNSNILNEYFVEFTTRSSGTTVSLPSSIKWANGVTPTFENGKTYQISIVNNLGTCVKFG